MPVQTTRPRAPSIEPARGREIAVDARRNRGQSFAFDAEYAAAAGGQAGIRQ